MATTHHHSDKFALLVVEISQMLLSEELAQMKLHMRATSLLRICDIDTISHTADLFRILIDKNKIGRANLSLLMEILRLVKRNDLVKKVCQFLSQSNPVLSTDSSVSNDKYSHITDYENEAGGSQNSEMSVDDDLDISGLTQCSVRSVTDEQKASHIKEPGGSQNSQMSVDDDGCDGDDMLPLSGRSITDEEKARKG